MDKRIRLIRGDITTLQVDAIVNAANTKLIGGGGVDGAIHYAGGPQILEECRAYIDENGECSTGEAVMTTAGNLPSKYVIHTVGPVWQGGRFAEEQMLERCYWNSLAMANNHDLHKVAFPNISTGIYGYPKEEAAEVAIRTVTDFLDKHPGMELVFFVCYGEDNYKIYEKMLNLAK